MKINVILAYCTLCYFQYSLQSTLEWVLILHMIMFIMQKIINHAYKMGVIKQINIKNRTYYFYNDIIDLENFKSNLLKIDKKSYKDIGIYNIGYITIKKIDDYENIYSINPLYLIIDHASGYIEEKEMNKYLVFDSTDENKELLKK